MYLCGVLSPLFLFFHLCYFINFVSVVLSIASVCACAYVYETECVCQFCFPEDTWQCLETFLLVSQLGEGSYKHLVGRDL